MKHKEKDENDKKCKDRDVEDDKKCKDRDDDDKKHKYRYAEDENNLKNDDDDEEKLKANDNDEKKLGDRNGEDDRKRRDVYDGTVTMVTLEARAMTKTGDASSWKGFKLSRTHQPWTTTDHG